jgi:hypothetical protein
MFCFCANTQGLGSKADVDQYNIDVIGGDPPLTRRWCEAPEVSELLVDMWVFGWLIRIYILVICATSVHSVHLLG